MTVFPIVNIEPVQTLDGSIAGYVRRAVVRNAVRSLTFSFHIL
jgi:hypothetical protein